MNTIFISFIILFLLSFLLFSVFFLGTEMENNFCSMSVFECGFLSFASTHKSFSLQIFILLVVFVCFDLELVILVTIFMGWGVMYIFGFLLFMVMTVFMEWWWGSIKWLN